jgi:hypothetical protein
MLQNKRANKTPGRLTPELVSHRMPVEVRLHSLSRKAETCMAPTSQDSPTAN